MDSQRLKRLPVGSVSLQFAGELIVPKLNSLEMTGLFKRFQVLFECFANMPREERLINYKMINALMLTSYAKKATDADAKKRLFQLKNALYFDIANNRDTRRKMAFKYLVSKNFRVLKFCEECTARNSSQSSPDHQWKFCNKCHVDRSFYNVLSMHHRFPKGFTTLFLSNDLVPEIRGIQLKNRGKLTDHDEEARLERFQFNVRNLDAISLDSVMEMFRKILPNFEHPAQPVIPSSVEMPRI